MESRRSYVKGGILAAVSILTACGGGSPSELMPSDHFRQASGPPRFDQLSDVMVDGSRSGAANGGILAVHTNRSRSWMAPGAKGHTLLYVSNYDGNDVFVYTYPGGKLVGTLTGFYGPDGVCADKKGDVWIVNDYETNSGENIVEYKHGGTTPIATVYDPAYVPTNCSVNPINGDLAVAKF